MALQEARAARFGGAWLASKHGCPPTSGRLRRLRGYFVGLVLLGVCTLLAAAGASLLRSEPFVMVFPLAVIVVTARFGVGPAIFTAVGGVLVFDFVFVPPSLAFSVADARDGWTLAAMLVVAVLTGVLVEQLRRQAQDARRRAEIEGVRNALLSAVSHDLRTPLTALVGASTRCTKSGSTLSSAASSPAWWPRRSPGSTTWSAIFSI